MEILARAAMLTVILVVTISSVGCQVPRQVEPPVAEPPVLDEEEKDTIAEVATFQLDLTSLQIGHEAAMYEARIRSEEMQDGAKSGAYGPHPGSLIPKGVYLILYDRSENPLRRVSMATI